MYKQRIGDGKGTFYEIEVRPNGAAIVKEQRAQFTTDLWTFAAGQDPRPDDFRREGKRICEVIAEGRGIVFGKKNPQIVIGGVHPANT